MAEVINTNVFDANKKFVDFSGLDYFWTKAKTYIDGVDASMSAKVVVLENTVGDSTKGLVKDVNYILDELETRMLTTFLMSSKQSLEVLVQ